MLQVNDNKYFLEIAKHWTIHGVLMIWASFLVCLFKIERLELENAASPENALGAENTWGCRDPWLPWPFCQMLPHGAWYSWRHLRIQHSFSAAHSVGIFCWLLSITKHLFLWLVSVTYLPLTYLTMVFLCCCCMCCSLRLMTVAFVYPNPVYPKAFFTCSPRKHLTYSSSFPYVFSHFSYPYLSLPLFAL